MSKFPGTVSFVNSVSSPISDGMVPVSLHLCNASHFNFESLPKFAGIFPVNSLAPMLRTSKFVSVSPKALGIGPVSFLFHNSRLVKPVSANSSGGIGPLRTLLPHDILVDEDVKLVKQELCTTHPDLAVGHRAIMM